MARIHLKKKEVLEKYMKKNDLSAGRKNNHSV
jgi:hypothetical protein